jgi:hypothetical protein
VVDELTEAIRAALADPAVRANVAALLTGEDDARKRRLAELERELAGMELRWGKADEP